jgi:hypothetical protein
MLEGESRARGVHLEGYGVFFDVRVPMMRQSMMWSMQVLMNQGDAASRAAINDIRSTLQGITDPATRVSLENAVRQLERQTPSAGTPGCSGDGDARDEDPGDHRQCAQRDSQRASRTAGGR